MLRRVSFWLTLSVMLLLSPRLHAQEATPAAAPHDATRLILATTTSTQDSGLLDYLLPVFEKQFGIEVDVIAVGTGQAIELGRNGDADVILVHARAREDEFVEQGFGTARYDVMYNDFIVVGSPDDPAGIAGMTDAAAAFLKLAETESSFVSRGDDSGTYTKELSIWNKAGLEPAGGWYISAGQGMGEVLTMANELQAYTLSDRATYVSMQDKLPGLTIVVEGDPVLFNPYGVIPVNPDVHPQVNATAAQVFVDWLMSVEVQQLIAESEVNEQALFVPDSELWREAQVEATPEATPEVTPGS